MTLLEILRNKAFWVIDSIRGSQVRKAYDIIEKCDKGIWSDDQIEDYQRESLKRLLAHSRKTVPTYKKLLSDDITKWPVVNKIQLKNNSQHLSENYKIEDLIIMSTSGSTGTPFRCYQDVIKKRHVNAEVLYYNGLVNFKIGKRIIYFRSIVGEVSKSKLTQFAQNIILLDCTSLDDDGIKDKLSEIRKATANGGGMILSYASTLDAFRKYFQKYGYEEAKGCNVYGVVSGSEMLHDITRKTLEEAFCCKVVSRYSNEENGFLGQDDIDYNVFIPNRADYYYEILKLDADEPAKMGEVGRIVITDLYNYAMPFVRYDTGDVGAWVYTTHHGKQVKAIGNFGGRIVDMIFDSKGNQISPHTITNLMWEFQDIKQYQFTQKTKTSYHIKVNIAGEKLLQEDLLLRTIKDKIGKDAIITVEYCDEIPVLASGKRRYIVNEMNKK